MAGVFDDVPNAFTFTNQTTLDPATPVTSNAVVLAGMGVGAVANVTTTAGTLVINGSDCASNCQVDNGDTLAVRLTTSGSSLGNVSATVSVGTVSSTFTATTKVVTLTYTGHVLVHSETGCNDGNIWHFECGTADQWVPAASFASNDLIATCGLPDGTTCLNTGSSRRWSSVSSLTVNTFVLNCSSVPPDLNSRTSCPAANTTLIKSGGIVAVDDTPSAFPYTALTNQAVSTLVISNAATLTGMGSGVNAIATTTLGTLVKNGSDCAAPCSVANGDAVAVKVTSSASFSTAVTATVAIGNTSSIFTATTSAPPGTTPTPFSYTTQIGQATNSLITSNAVTIAGLGSGVNATATTTLGSLIKNGVVCGAPCTVANGNTLASRVTSSVTAATSVAATVTVGTYATSFTVVTAGAAGQLLFLNVTPSLVNSAPRVTQHFWAGLPDVNGDGCFDLFTGTHADELADSALMLQNRSNSGCAGTFTYMDTTTSNYTQPTAAPRITSRYLWGNWYGHTQGLWSFLGQDVDGGASARYVVSNTTTSGAIPQYDTKTIGCNGSQMFCLPVDIDGDGVIELATRLRHYTTPNMGYILNAATGAVKFTPTFDAAGSAYGNAHAVLDLDNDGYPEIVQPTNRGYWKYNPVGGAITWQANKFPATVPGTLAAGNHLVPIDYDSDGDMDLYFGVATYSADNNAVLHAIKRDNIFDVYFYRNNGDGTFTDVTVAADLGAANLLKNTYFHSTYSNTVAVDINLDGFPDLVYGGESAGHSATATRVTMLMNNGNGTFTVNRNNNFGTYVDSPNFQGRPWVNSADYDNDGLLDIVKTAGISGPNHESIALYRNVTNTSGNDWLRVRVRGFGNNTDGLHTRLVFRDVGTNAIITTYQIGAFTTGYVNLIPHAGLGNRATVKLEVFYPHGGPSYTFNNLSTNQDVIVFRNGTLLQNYTPGSKIPLTPTEAGTYTGAVIAPLIADPSTDTTPNSFTYTNLIDQANSTLVTSNALGIAGLGSSVNASASTTLGSLIKNGSACGAPCTVVNGDTLAVSVTTSATAGVTVSATVTVGTYSTTFNATTLPLAADTTPDAFTYTAQTLLELNTQVTSNAVSIAGLGAGVSANATTNLGQLIKNGVVCAAPCTVTNGNTLGVRVTTAAVPETTVTATVAVGTVSTTFSATTFLLDTPPGSLTFSPVTGAVLTNVYDSSAITVGWLGAATAVSTNNGTLLINGTTCASSCTVGYGNTLAVRLISSGSASTLVSATVTVNGVSGTFNVTTGAGGGGGADTTPDAFTFTAQTGLAPSTAVTSNATTVAGLGSGVNAVVTTTAGSLLKNGSACGSPCTAANGDTIAVNLTTSANGLTAVTATVTIGTANAVFSATTQALGSVPGSLSFTAVTGANLSLTYDSNSITINWIGVQTTVNITNGLLLKNGNLCGDPCSVNFGDQLAVRLTASDIASTLISANVSIGAVNGAFNVTTAAGGGGGGGDTTPDAFAFTAQPSVNPSTLVTSNAITVAGLGSGINASVTTTLGSLVKNGVACAGPCTVVNGNTLAVSVTSAATGLTAVNATVTIGTVNAGFSATTVALGPTPGSLNFNPVVGAELSQSYSSNSITVNWIGVPTAVTTSAGILLKNGNTCLAPCSIAFGNQLGVQLTSSGTANTLVSATVTLGGVNGTFNVTTGAAPSSGGGGGGGGGSSGGGSGGSGGGSTSTLILGDSPNLEIQPGQQITNQGTLINPINNGTVNGGNLSGNVTNSGTGILNNVNLISGTTVTGGSLSGILTGTGTVKNAVVNVLEIAPGVVIGSGSKVTTTTVTNVAGLVLTGALTDATGNLQLNQPLLINPDGTQSSVQDINKSAIDKLFGNQSTQVSNQTGTSGVVIANSGLAGAVIPVNPVSVVTTKEPDSVSAVNATGELVIVSNGIKTTFTPSASDLAAFQAGIDANGGDTNLLANGLVFIEFSGGTFSVRFSLIATTPPNPAVSGLVSIAAISQGMADFSQSGSLAKPATYRIIVKYSDGKRQELLPAIHNPTAFQSWLSSLGMSAVLNGVDGTIQILNSSKVVIWRGIASYSLLPLPTGSLGAVTITATPDLNGDGIADIYFNSLTHRQAIYGLPLQ